MVDKTELTSNLERVIVDEASGEGIERDQRRHRVRRTLVNICITIVRIEAKQVEALGGGTEEKMRKVGPKGKPMRRTGEFSFDL